MDKIIACTECRVCLSAEPGQGKVEKQQVGEETTKTGAPKEIFGEGRAAQSEAGKKGGAISGAQYKALRANRARS